MPRCLALDIRMWDHPGIGRYIRELSKELLLLDRETRYLLLDLAAVRAPIYSLQEQWQLTRAARSADALHVPHFNIPFFYPKKLIVTIHDLIYLEESGAAKSPWAKIYVKTLLKQIARKSAAIFAVSQATKNDLLNSGLGFKENRIFVTPEAASDLFKKIDDPSILEAARNKFNLKKPFILFVGTLKPHKNVPTLVLAVAQLRARLPDTELVIVGKKDPREERLSQEILSQPFVRYLGTVRDEELVNLYNLAEVFVLPSRREGFGLPILEAMACGAPVAVSNCSSLAEVAGQAGLLFDPSSVDALEEVLYNILTDKELQLKKARESRERARSFSWGDTALKTLDVYRKVLS